MRSKQEEIKMEEEHLGYEDDFSSTYQTLFVIQDEKKNLWFIAFF